MMNPFLFTEDDPASRRGHSLEDGVTLSGRVRVWASACGYWPGPEPRCSFDFQPDYHVMPRLCIDGLSPLRRWFDFSWSGGFLFFDGRPPYSRRLVGWEIETRHYANGPHTLAVASWRYFHTGDGNCTTLGVSFHNPEAELTAPPPPAWNPNVPALWTPGTAAAPDPAFASARKRPWFLPLPRRWA